MAKIAKISVSITSDQLAKIEAAVERGDYPSTSDGIRTLLQEWELKEELRRQEAERLGRLWDEGLASGPARDGPATMAELAKKYENLAKPKPSKQRV